jgi:hypothetical protein
MVDIDEQHVHIDLDKVKTIRIQNQRLKKQLEMYTLQFRQLQHDVNVKNHDLSTLKIEIDRYSSIIYLTVHQENAS